MSAKYTFWAWSIKLTKAPLKLALLQLADNANDDGVSWYSVPKMADRCGMSERALQGHLKSLVDMGLLEIKDRPGTSSVYQLQYQEATLIAPQILRPTPADSAPPPPQNLRPTPADSADDPNNESNKIDPVIEKHSLSGKPDDVLEVFEHWKTIMAKPRAKLDDARRRMIQRALKGGYTVDDLKKAVDGCRASPFHMGENTQRTKYNGLELILRNSEKIDGFMERVGASRPRSAHTGFQPEDYQGMEYVSPGAEEWLNGGDHG